MSQHSEFVTSLRRAGIIYEREAYSRKGIKFEYYVDFKRVSGYPKLLTEAADKLIKLIPNGASCVAAEGHGGIPLAVLVSQKTNLPLSLVRHRQRKHGTRKMVDGYMPTRSDKIVVVDDVLSTGSSIKETGDVLLREIGVETIQAVVVVKRGEVSVNLSFPVKHLVNVEELYN